MRINIQFRLKNNSLNLNYNIGLTALIYRFINSSDNNFAQNLHNYGYKKDNRNFKLFVFSDLQCEIQTIRNQTLILKNNILFWSISSPLDDFIKHLIQGLFIQGTGIILDNQLLNIEKVEVLSTPELNSIMKFRMLSPLVVSTKKKINEKLSQYYLRYYDDCSSIILQNLKRKYALINGKEHPAESLKIIFDKDYINSQIKRGLREDTVCSALRHIVRYNKSSGNYEDIKIKGILCPFEISADSELVKVGYECGFGEKNSIGFGMVEII